MFYSDTVRNGHRKSSRKHPSNCSKRKEKNERKNEENTKQSLWSHQAVQWVSLDASTTLHPPSGLPLSFSFSSPPITLFPGLPPAHMFLRFTLSVLVRFVLFFRSSPFRSRCHTTTNKHRWLRQCWCWSPLLSTSTLSLVLLLSIAATFALLLYPRSLRRSS